nr:hypothetical protein [Promicromonospora panici]
MRTSRPTSTAVARATAPSTAWLAATTALRGHRSTTAPPATPKRRPGAAWTASESPVAAGEPVICRTSRFWTVICIHVPALETRFAPVHQRIAGWRSARHGERPELVEVGTE